MKVKQQSSWEKCENCTAQAFNFPMAMRTTKAFLVSNVYSGFIHLLRLFGPRPLHKLRFCGFYCGHEVIGMTLSVNKW